MFWAVQEEISLLLQRDESGLQRKRRRQTTHGTGVFDRETERRREGAFGPGKSPAKCDVQAAESNFQTRSGVYLWIGGFLHL